MATGKGPVGFLNPALYANPWVMNDIVNGSNVGCKFLHFFMSGRLPFAFVRCLDSRRLFAYVTRFY